MSEVVAVLDQRSAWAGLDDGDALPPAGRVLTPELRSELVQVLRQLTRLLGELDQPESEGRQVGSVVHLQRRAGSPERLTPRETEVATLVAEGRTNRDVARALDLSVRTVEAHVERVLGKLGLGNRTQLAVAWFDGLRRTEPARSASTLDRNAVGM